MIGPCLALLLGGAPWSPQPARHAPDPAELRLCHAVVVPAEALDWASLDEDPDPAENPPAKAAADQAPQLKTAVLSPAVPTKEP